MRKQPPYRDESAMEFWLEVAAHLRRQDSS